VRLACPCGRSLADVRLATGTPPDEVYESSVTARTYDEHVWPFPRPGVGWDVHEHGRETWASHRFTFRLSCRCGRTHEVRSNRIDAAWQEYAREGRNVSLILGRDL
jgi:hypothetical protein